MVTWDLLGSLSLHNHLLFCSPIALNFHWLKFSWGENDYFKNRCRTPNHFYLSAFLAWWSDSLVVMFLLEIVGYGTLAVLVTCCFSMCGSGASFCLSHLGILWELLFRKKNHISLSYNLLFLQWYILEKRHFIRICFGVYLGVYCLFYY